MDKINIINMIYMMNTKWEWISGPVIVLVFNVYLPIINVDGYLSAGLSVIKWVATLNCVNVAYVDFF